jgi:hypothetical protein
MKPVKVKTRSEQDSKQPKYRSINTQNSGNFDVNQRDQLSLRDILAAQDILIFWCRFGALTAFNGKSFTTKVVGLDDTFDLYMWKAQF